MRGFGPNVIHFWGCGHASLSPVSLACRGAARHFVTPDYPQDAAHRAVRYSHARWLVSSQAIAASWRRAGVPSDQLDVFPPAALPIAAQPTHSDFGFPPAGLKFVLCAGRLVPKGGWREAIWSFNILHFLHPEAHLLIAGDGPQLDDLKRFTRAIGMQQNVHLLGWRKDLGNLIALSECVWSPSLVDGVPLVLLEALAAGKPVVASQQPSVIEMVTHRETALVVPPADRPALAKQTRSLLESPAVAREMGARGRELVRRHFSHEQWVERHVEAYLQAA